MIPAPPRRLHAGSEVLMSFHRFYWQHMTTGVNNEPADNIDPPDDCKIDVGKDGAWKVVATTFEERTWARLCVRSNTPKQKERPDPPESVTAP